MEKERIAKTTIKNNNNPWYGTIGGRDTRDKIFLLSIEEVINYFGDSGDLRNRKGWYRGNNRFVLDDGKGHLINDQYNTERAAKDADGQASWWWLRSPGKDSKSAAIVHYGGSVFVYGSDVIDYIIGFRPALWLNLKP